MRSVVFVKSANETGRDGNQKISRPIAGSFIHTGHGDIRDGKGWGNPEYIDKIYLTNPVVGQPNSSSAPQIIDSILPPPHKAKPNLPSKPPASSSNAVSEGIPLSPTMRDPFDDVRLSRATRQVAPTPTLMQPIVQQVGSSQFYVPSMNQPIPARVAPAPPTTQPKVHSNGNAAVPRPKVNLPQEPSSSRSANNTPPMIKADAFVNVRNAAQRMDGFVIAPKTSGAGIPLAVIEPGPAPKSSVGIGHGQNILNELQSKIGKGNEPIRLRQQPTTSAETPVFVHSQMNTMRAPSSFSSISPNAHDPFEVPSAVKNVLQKDRYNEIMEKNSLQPAPSPPAYNQPHRHPNSTPQLHVNQVLQPIQSPSSARATTSPHPLQNFHHAQGPVHPSLNHVHLGQASRMSMITPPTVAIPQQQRPMSQVLTATPIKQQPTLAQQQLQQQKQQEMILQQIQQQKQEQFLREQRMQQEKLAQEKLLQQQREQQIRQQREQLAKQQMPKVESTPALLPTQGLKPSGQNGVRQTTAAALSTPVLQPTKVELPSATANVKPTSQTPKSEPKQAVNSNAQNGQAQASGSSRRHTTEIDFTTIFPAPSALFYGSDSTKSTSSQGDQPQQIRPPISTIAAAIPTVDVVREARVIPSVLPSSSVLQPTPLHHANLNSAAQQRRASTSTPIVAPPAQKAATPRPAASVLPSEPLVPTPLYPKISTIAQPQTQNVSPPRARGFSQEQVDAILALSSRPQSIHSVPLFSAQQSLGSTYSNGYGGYNSPIYGMGYGASSPIYGGYGMNGFNGLNGYGSMGRLSNTSSVYPLLSDSSRPLALTAPLRPLTPPPPSSTIVQHSEEVLNSFDPLAELYNNSQSTLPRESQPTTSGVTKAEQMEILYKEASFAERGNCDRMVGICGGNVEEALKQLKVEYLVDTGIASDRAIAISALEARAWNLNAAAEAIVSR
ncbi:unnamed protein product, partial [Mesorhabditis belari]|uniref:non-specific protein-tyrosine kinase n=1 Tax=Mesorhabditis belari TaxID=2138241 RepID=A0AAF3ER48_9BILA